MGRVGRAHARSRYEVRMGGSAGQGVAGEEEEGLANGMANVCCSSVSCGRCARGIACVRACMHLEAGLNQYQENVLISRSLYCVGTLQDYWRASLSWAWVYQVVVDG